MTTITNKEREAAIKGVLEATFAPLIVAFKDKLRTYFIQQTKENEPHFVAASVNPHLIDHLKRTVVVTPMFVSHYEHNGETRKQNVNMRWPEYFRNTVIKDNGVLGISGEYDHVAPCLAVEDVFLPYGENKVASPELSAEYLALAVKRQAAQEELNKVFYSYTNREKFEVDFPELARYLPKKPIKSKGTAVAIPVADFKATLLGLGIPPSEAAT